MKDGDTNASTDATARRSARGQPTAAAPLEYQSLCRHIIEFMRREEGWQPYEGDGIDVPIEVKGTTVTFDIALAPADRRRILLGECKAWGNALEQDHIFTLFGKITAVASETDATVEGVLFASSGFDPGPTLAAPGVGIRIFEVRKGQPRHAFTLAQPRVDEASGRGRYRGAERRAGPIGVIERASRGAAERSASCPVGA